MRVSLANYKLCGFLLPVLSASSRDNPNLLHTVKPGALCYIFSDGSRCGFKCNNGVVLSLIDSSWGPRSAVDGVVLGYNTDQCGSVEREAAAADVAAGKEKDSQKNLTKTGGLGKRQSDEGMITASRTRTRVRAAGMVNGSISVVSQLYALVTDKCLKIVSRVVDVEIGLRMDWRAVILVDVYLPVEVWSGWQFPRSRSTAVVLFKHLSCDWGLRSSILTGEKFWKGADGKSESIWDLSDCHVLGCKLNCGVSSPSKQRLFELHDIFKGSPSIKNEGLPYSSRVLLPNDSSRSGILVLPDDILLDILNRLGPLDLVRIAPTCQHLRSLAASVVPYLKLKLLPHQHAAVEWMLWRERNGEVLPHPQYVKFLTEDGLCFYLNVVYGDIVTGPVPTIRDFRGGMLSDEPGLGKTITALALILKTQGAMAQPPDDAQVIWCTHNGKKRCALYEPIDDRFMPMNMSSGWRDTIQSAHRFQFSLDFYTAKEKSMSSSLKGARLMKPGDQVGESGDIFLDNGLETPKCALTLTRQKNNSLHPLERVGADIGEQNGSRQPSHASKGEHDDISYNRKRKATTNYFVQDGTWIHCDACSKWRKISYGSIVDFAAKWYCHRNTDPLHRFCEAPEETWGNSDSIYYLQGFCTKGNLGGMDENVSFFTKVLKKHKSSINCTTERALVWLATLSPEELFEMEVNGLTFPPFLSSPCIDEGYHNIFQAFGLVKRFVNGYTRWYYPPSLFGLAFDLAALSLALCQALDTVMKYVSKTTLIVAPGNLVDHWKTQIERHVKPGKLRFLIWTDNREKPSARSLAWDYDVVIISFNRLSECSYCKNNPLTQVHWLRIMLDEGHTLCSSVRLTDKLKMAISLTASSRWLLARTLTLVTPNNQISHLQPLLKFLREEAYGKDAKAWEACIVRTLDAKMEEGYSRLLQLLQRCMISSRKINLQTLPPCFNKVTYLDFTEGHAKSYNELNETVIRNNLMGDHNDPSNFKSFLNPKQWKFCNITIRNMRLSACVAGHIEDKWKPDWQSTSSSKVSYLVQRLKLLQGTNFSPDHTNGPDSLGACKMSKASGFLRPPHHGLGDTRFPKKVLIFSQFREHIHLIEQQLTIAGIKFAGMCSPIHPSRKKKLLATFQHDASCLALLIDGGAVLGLDLGFGFVTHVFLMEPIWNRSMEEQVISRAHRVGAIHPVNVETLVMRGTIEVPIVDLIQANKRR